MAADLKQLRDGIVGDARPQCLWPCRRGRGGQTRVELHQLHPRRGLGERHEVQTCSTSTAVGVLGVCLFFGEIPTYTNKLHTQIVSEVLEVYEAEFHKIGPYSPSSLLKHLKP